jgi:alkylation response protein AidB-like acyl-CoA dehydrogenase
MIQDEDPNKTIYASMAKRFATDHCSELVDYALQMHGGYGYLSEYGI